MGPALPVAFGRPVHWRRGHTDPCWWHMATPRPNAASQRLLSRTSSGPGRVPWALLSAYVWRYPDHVSRASGCGCDISLSWTPGAEKDVAAEQHSHCGAQRGQEGPAHVAGAADTLPPRAASARMTKSTLPVNTEVCHACTFRSLANSSVHAVFTRSFPMPCPAMKMPRVCALSRSRRLLGSLRRLPE